MWGDDHGMQTGIGSPLFPSPESPTLPASPPCLYHCIGMREGLPIGTHFTARFGHEATLLRLAAQLEAARPGGGSQTRGYSLNRLQSIMSFSISSAGG